MQEEFRAKLAGLRSHIAEVQEEIFESGRFLSGTLHLQSGDLAEMRMWGRSIILGASGYMGLIDDDKKQVLFFDRCSTVCKAAFYAVYGPLQDSGYSVEALGKRHETSNEQQQKLAQFLVDQRIVDFAMSIAEGRHVPRQVGYVYLDGAEKYERSKFFSRSFDMGRMLGEKIGSDAGEAYGLKAAVAVGMPVVQDRLSMKTSFEARVEKSFEWPVAKNDVKPEENALHA
jgi:hypothetical protein